MHRELSEVVKMAIEIFICAMLIAVVVLFSFLTRSAEVQVQRNEAAKAYLYSSAELYHYNNKVVTGSDVVDCIITYPRSYVFEIEKKDGTVYKFNQATEMASGLGLGLWKVEYIETIILPDEMNDPFLAEFIRNDTGDAIEGIHFKME